MNEVKLRTATKKDDGNAILQILEPIVRAGETYAFAQEMTANEILDSWFQVPHRVYCAVVDGRTAGTYWLSPNHSGRGRHIANCAFATARSHEGQGVARSMCAHSLREAEKQGYRAMQYNFVISSNSRAVRLWRSMGFAEIGRIPEAYDHPHLGLVDALIMHRKL